MVILLTNFQKNIAEEFVRVRWEMQALLEYPQFLRSEFVLNPNKGSLAFSKGGDIPVCLLVAIGDSILIKYGTHIGVLPGIGPGC